MPPLSAPAALKGWAVPFEQQSDETWRRALEVNLTAPFVLVQAAADDLAGFRAWQRDQYFSSIYGLSGPDWRLYEGTSLGNPAAYAASKGGLVPGDPVARDYPGAACPGQCHCARRRVPGHAGAVFRAAIWPARPWGGWDAKKTSRERSPIWQAILSAYVTGQCLAVDGGWTAW